MKNYEGMFLVDTKESKKGDDSIEEDIKALISKCGGETAWLMKWDDRKLAYEIKGASHGLYFLTYFSGESDTIQKLNREIELSPLLLRALFLRIKDIPDMESQMKRPAEEREFGGSANGVRERGEYRPLEKAKIADGEERVSEELPAEPEPEPEPKEEAPVADEEKES